jgi:hypothetical protein
MTSEMPTSTDQLDAMLADPEPRQSLALLVADGQAVAARASMSATPRRSS